MAHHQNVLKGGLGSGNHISNLVVSNEGLSRQEIKDSDYDSEEEERSARMGLRGHDHSCKPLSEPTGLPGALKYRRPLLAATITLVVTTSHGGRGKRGPPVHPVINSGPRIILDPHRCHSVLPHASFPRLLYLFLIPVPPPRRTT